MSAPSITPNLIPQPDSSLWLNFDPHEDEKQLWLVEQEVLSQIEKVDQKFGDQLPIGKSANEVKQTKFVEDEDEEEEEDDDNDDEESDSHDDDDEEEIDMEVVEGGEPSAAADNSLGAQF